MKRSPYAIYMSSILADTLKKKACINVKFEYKLINFTFVLLMLNSPFPPLLSKPGMVLKKQKNIH